LAFVFRRNQRQSLLVARASEENENPGYFEFGERDVQLTEADRALPLSVVDLRWTDPRLPGPRDTRTGESLAAVSAKFSAQEEAADGTPIRILTEEEAASTLTYRVYDPDSLAGEYLTYDLTNGVVTAIAQGLYTTGE
jgi:hypothetical protein